MSERLVQAFPTTEHGPASETTPHKRSRRKISFYHGDIQHEIPYKLDSSLSDKERCLVESVMFNLMTISCIRFRAKTSSDSTNKFMSIVKENSSSTNLHPKVNANFVFIKSHDSYNSIMEKVLNFLILLPNVQAINYSFRCSNPLELDMNFVQQLVRHYRGCKSHLNITNSDTRSPKVEDNLVRNTRSAVVYTERLTHGDILVRSRSWNRRLQGSGIGNITKLWPNSGEIPFVFHKPLEKQHKCVLYSAMLQIMLNTCIRYRARTAEDEFYFNITDEGAARGCFASIGFDGDYADAGIASLPTICMDIGTVVHEFAHAIGFYHHQSRPDRDEHLCILRENIEKKHLENFEIVQDGKLLTRWDYNSIMLYGEKQFGVENKVTLKPKRPGVVLKDVYQKPGLSHLDAAAINRLYKCKSSSTTRLENNLYENEYFMSLFSELVNDDCQDPVDSDQSNLYIFY